MFIPDYTITNKILANISQLEYSKGVIENTTLLPGSLHQIQKETRTKTIYSNLKLSGLNISREQVKKFVDNISSNSLSEMAAIENALEVVEELAEKQEFSETDIKRLNYVLNLRGSFRSRRIENAPLPSELLVEIAELIDWCNSLEAKETHPLIFAGIVKARILAMQPFDSLNETTSNLVAYLILYTRGFKLQKLYCIEQVYADLQSDYDRIKNTFSGIEADYTEWLEYFTENLNREISNLKEKVLLVGKENKIAKAAGKHKLTPRQQKLVEYLQDYGVLYNRDFPKIFPDKSEDSILRDLKKLIEMKVAQKTGSTKSSRYELA